MCLPDRRSDHRHDPGSKGCRKSVPSRGNDREIGVIWHTFGTVARVKARKCRVFHLLRNSPRATLFVRVLALTTPTGRGHGKPIVGGSLSCIMS
jgi:hypothetical protein